jgi:hypothetical protein
MNPNDLPQTAADEVKTTAENLQNTWDTTKEKAAEALESGERFVRANPCTSTLSVLGVGFVLGLLVGWSMAHESHDDYAAQVRKLRKDWGRKLNLD